MVRPLPRCHATFTQHKSLKARDWETSYETHFVMVLFLAARAKEAKEAQFDWEIVVVRSVFGRVSFHSSLRASSKWKQRGLCNTSRDTFFIWVCSFVFFFNLVFHRMFCTFWYWKKMNWLVQLTQVNGFSWKAWYFVFLRQHQTFSLVSKVLITASSALWKAGPQLHVIRDHRVYFIFLWRQTRSNS